MNYPAIFIYRHLEGKDADGRDVVGLYVFNEDNTCHINSFRYHPLQYTI